MCLIFSEEIGEDWLLSCSNINIYYRLNNNHKKTKCEKNKAHHEILVAKLKNYLMHHEIKASVIIILVKLDRIKILIKNKINLRKGNHLMYNKFGKVCNVMIHQSYTIHHTTYIIRINKL